MKILIVDTVLPWPVNSGGIMRTWSYINALRKKHKLSLLVHSSRKLENIPILKECFENIWVISSDKNKKQIKTQLGALKDIYNSVSWEISGHYSHELNMKFREIIVQKSFDIILFRQLYAAQYLFRNKDILNVKTVIDLDDIESIKVKRTMEASNIKYKNLYDKLRRKFNYHLLVNYHKNLKQAHKCIVSSEKDKKYIKKKWTNMVEIIPNTIDVDSFQGIKNFTIKNISEKIILFCGILDYEANKNGLEWFINNIFSLISSEVPGVKLYIVGKNPQQPLYNYIDNKRIFLYSNVPSVIPYYEKCSLAIVPLKVGGGTRIKILEALSCKRPIVSTTIGAEGLNLINDEHCLIADDPESFAKACTKLLKNYELSEKITEEGYKFVRNNYDKEAIYAKIDKVFNDF